MVHIIRDFSSCFKAARRESCAEPNAPGCDSSTSGGDPLSLAILDEAVARCNNAKFLFVGRQMHIRFT